MTSNETLKRKELKKVTQRPIPCPYLIGIVKDATGSFTGGLLFLSAALLIGGILTLVVRYDSFIAPVDTIGR